MSRPAGALFGGSTCKISHLPERELVDPVPEFSQMVIRLLNVDDSLHDHLARIGSTNANSERVFQ